MSHPPLVHTTIDPRWTVNETLAAYPETVAVFNAFGLDACCGGAAPIAEAAARDGAPLGALLASLDEVVRAARGAVAAEG